MCYRTAYIGLQVRSDVLFGGSNIPSDIIQDVEHMAKSTTVRLSSKYLPHRINHQLHSSCSFAIKSRWVRNSCYKALGQNIYLLATHCTIQTSQNIKWVNNCK